MLARARSLSRPPPTRACPIAVALFLLPACAGAVRGGSAAPAELARLRAAYADDTE
jgi:hypothetical protein